MSDKKTSAPTTTSVELNFSGRMKYLQINAVCWGEAQRALQSRGVKMSDAMVKEQACVAKLIQVAKAPRSAFDAKMKAPTSADHDVIICLKGKDITVDIKTLFPDENVIRSSNEGSNLCRDNVQYEVGSAYAKEQRQGNICCFDISHLHANYIDHIQQHIVTNFRDCLMLRYTNTTLRLIWPDKQIDFEIRAIT